jgi:hypothetical protein
MPIVVSAQPASRAKPTSAALRRGAAPATVVPEWRTQQWKCRVEAEARKRLKTGIGGIARRR